MLSCCVTGQPHIARLVNGTASLLPGCISRSLVQRRSRSTRVNSVLMQREVVWGGASHTVCSIEMYSWATTCLVLLTNRQKDASRRAYNSCTSGKPVLSATWYWPTIVHSSFYIARLITGCLHSPIVKPNNKNGRQTEPHPQLTQVSQDSQWPVESDADLQLLIYNIKRNSQKVWCSYNTVSTRCNKVKWSPTSWYVQRDGFIFFLLFFFFSRNGPH